MKDMQKNKTRTKKAIIAAFQNLMTTTPFDKITIQNIADIAEINRHSFYNHFVDKYDLLYQIVTQMLVIDYDVASGKESLIQQTINQAPLILHYFEENREFFKSAFKDDKQHSFNNFFQKLIFDWFTTILNSDETDVNKNNSFHKTQARFYVAGYSQLLIYWLYNEPDKPASVLAEELVRIFKGAF